MANIKQYTDNIRKAIYGKEVRESLATGIEVINTEVEKNTTHVNKTSKDIEKFKNDINLAESQRVSAENKRISDEKIRVINEEARKEEFKKIVNENSAWDKKLSNLYNTNNSSLTDLNKSFKSKYDNLEKEYAKEITNVKDVQGQPGVSYKVNSLGVHPSSNGFITDVVLKGRTLINIMPMNSSEWKINGDGLNAVNYIRLDSLPVKPNTKYSYKLFNLPDKYDSHWFHLLEPLTTKDKKGTFTSISNIGRSYLHLYPKEGQKFTLEEVKDVKILLVEGEHDLNEYFEGMKSVGDRPQNIVFSSYNKDYEYRTETNIESTRFNYVLKNRLEENRSIKNISDKVIYLVLHNTNESKWVKDISIEPGESYSVENGLSARTITIYPSNGWIIKNNKIRLNQIISIDNFTLKNNKELLYLYPTGEWSPVILRGITGGAKDIIFGTKDKTIFNQKCDILNSKNYSEFFELSISGTSVDKSILRVWFKPKNRTVAFNTKAQCNLLNYSKTLKSSEEGISVSNGIDVQVLKSKLPTPDLNGFIQWMKTSSFEILYQMGVEYYFNCVSALLRTYDGNTILDIKSGPIKPDIECYMPHSILSSLKGISDKLEGVDESIIKLLIDVANKANKEHDHYGTYITKSESDDRYAQNYLGKVTDFNNCKDSYGVWFVESGTSIPNAPFTGGIWGSLEVLKATVPGDCMQRFTTPIGEVYSRYYHSSASKWSNWVDYETKPFLPSRGQATDFNLCTKPGRYTISAKDTLPNAPYSGGVWGYLDVIRINESEIIQKFTVSGPGSVYTRIYNFEHKWFNWVKTPTVEDFECKNGQSGGYQKLPNGIIIQWGSTVIPFDGYRAHGYLYYPIAFKEYVHCCGNVASNDYGGFCETSGTVAGDTLSRAYAEALDVGNGNKQGHNVRFQWIAIGK